MYECMCVVVPAAHGGGEPAAPRGRGDDSAAGERREGPHPQIKEVTGPTAAGRVG